MRTVLMCIINEGNSFMVKVPKVVNLLPCAFLLGLGLSNTALAIENSLATDEIKAQQNSEKKCSLPGLFKQDAVRE